MKKELGVILNNVRSCENVGSILRTAEFFGFRYVWFVGVTPYPDLTKLKSDKPSPQSSPSRGEGDERLPHIRQKLDKKIKKVSLGAEENLGLAHYSTLAELISKLKEDGWEVVALEQDKNSVKLSEYQNKSEKVVLVLGTERTGLSFEDLSLVDEIIEIPGFGQKESLNVSVAFGVTAAELTV